MFFSENPSVVVIGLGYVGLLLAVQFAKTYRVIGFDTNNINDYYDVNLKYRRLAELGIIVQPREKKYGTEKFQSSTYPGLYFVYSDLTEIGILKSLFAVEQFDIVINLAAQAGVRYSLTNLDVYIESNISGFLNILETL
jgi:UDP-glucuronate 4-epimerase